MLVGRVPEQQAIARLAAAARLGTSGVLALAGEPGVGKTALLDATAATLGGMRILRATGLEAERDLPFAMLLQLLRPVLDRMDGIPPLQASALAAALALPGAAPTADAPLGAPTADRFTIGAAVLSLICRAAESEPIAVIVDDLQFADASSASALVFAARRLAPDPVVVLLGVRTPEGDAIIEGLPSLRLQGLDPGAARTLVTRSLGGAPTEERLRLLYRATDGNPLALLELASADRDVVESAMTGLPLRVPHALVEAFGRRLAPLDDECRAALLVAAVCGSDLRLITDACGVLGVGIERLGDAEDLRLVTVRGERVEFRHPLLRAATYSGAAVRARREAHRAAAEATTAADPDRRAWHLSEATWHPDNAVAELLASTARRAIRRGAHVVAASAFERAARLSPGPHERAARLLRAADNAWIAGDAQRALALLDQRARDAAAPADGVPDAADAELRAAIAARSGSLREALRLLLDTADRAGTADDATIALADAVHATYYLGDARTASTLADRLDRVRAGVATSRARALGLMATGIARILAGTGGADDIRAAIPLLEAEPELVHDERRLSWLLLAPLFLRDATSGARLRALVDEVRGGAGVGALPAVLFHVARDEAASAAWARAEADYTEAIRLATETGQTTELAMSLAGLAWLDSHAGRADACREHATAASELCRARDIHIGEVWVGHALGDLELSLGRPESAIVRYTELTALLDRLGLDDVDLSPAPEMVDAFVRLGRRQDAVALAARTLEHATDKGQPWARARAHRALGLAASEDEFDACFAAAIDWHGRTRDRFETARTQLAWGERLRRIGRRVDAREHLREAHGAFTELGASVWRDRAAAELTATGEHVRHEGSDPLAALTPQELQVSLLLAGGRTTREAAAALFLSPKTVEYHLRKVYVKLGIGSRAKLAEALRPVDRADRTRSSLGA